MLDGPFWRLLILTLVLLGPGLAAASPPATNLESAYSLGGQQITDLAMDPTGEYVTGVVSVDATKLTGGLPLPGAAPHKDIYPCDFGPPSSRAAGSGCRGIVHSTLYGSTQTGASQSVAYSSYVSSQQPYFAVGGPSATVGMWSGVSDSPQWESNSTQTGVAVGDVAVSPDASRIVAAIVPASSNLAGSIEVYAGRDGTTGQLPVWHWTFSDSTPTSMDYARNGGYLAVGTAAVSTGPQNPGTSAVYVFRPSSGNAPNAGDIPTLNTVGAVNNVKFSRNADALAVAAKDGVYYSLVYANGTPVSPKWSRSIDGGVQRVALALNGERFAAAAGTRIYFYRATHANTVAEQVGDSYDTGSQVADVAYDSTGALLVAVSGNRVFGFGPDSTKPIWSFDATDPAHGGLDGPLKRVVVSDGAERFVVAGATKIMPYRDTISASGQFTDPQGMTVTPGTHQQFTLSVTNTGSLVDTYSFIAHFPVGWNGDSPDAITLAPDETKTVAVAVDVPAGTTPGVYGLDVQIRSGDLTAAGATTTSLAGPAINFTLPRAVVLNLTTSEDRIPSLKQGGEETVPVTVRNRGNAEGLINLTATQALSRGPPWPLTFSQDQVRVPAGGEVTVNLVVATSGDAASGDRNDITICAREGQPTACQNDGSFSEASHTITAYVDPKFGADLSSRNSTYEFGPGDIQTIFVTVTNTGNTEDTFNFTANVTPQNVENDWRAVIDHPTLTMARGDTRQLSITVRAGVSEPRDASLVINAYSSGNRQFPPGVVCTLQGVDCSNTATSGITLSLVAKPPTTTPTKSLVPGFEGAAALGAIGLVALVAGARRRLRRGGRP